MITLDTALFRLSANADTIATLVRGLPDAQARWKPSPAERSILEVIGHLVDEEREDFRQRVDYLLHRPGEEFPPIDPEGWVTARAYNQQPPGERLSAFLGERRESLLWLKSLNDPNWQASRPHPAGGVMTAGDMLAAWVAHDHLHIRQLNELHWQYLAREASPGALDYAGGW